MESRSFFFVVHLGSRDAYLSQLRPMAKAAWAIVLDPKVGWFLQVFLGGRCVHITPLKTNMEPKNAGLEDDFPFQTGDFQVPC